MQDIPCVLAVGWFSCPYRFSETFIFRIFEPIWL